MNDSLLIIDERNDYLSLIEVIIESEFQVNIIKSKSYDEANKYLDVRKDIKAILFNLNATCTNLENTNHIPLIAYGKDLAFLKDKETPYVENPFDEENLYSALGPLLTYKEDHLQIELDGTDTPLKKVNLITLGLFSEFSYDLYLKLSGDKFIQVGKEGNDDLKEIIEHYKSKKITHLYLKESDYYKYLDHAKSIIKANQSLSRENSKKFTTIEIFDFAFQISRDQLQAIGLTKFQEEFVHSAMEELIVDLKEHKTIYQRIKEFFKEPNYIVDHSLLTIYLCSMILKKMGWSNEQTIKQVIYAGFFHDIFITEELARIRSLEDLNLDRDKRLVLHHISAAAEILEGIKGINNDAHKMIIDHHELPDGTGYPHGLTANQLPPLSCVFILAHYIVDYLYDENFETKNLTTFIQQMQSVWDQGNFTRPYKCARSLLLD